MYKQFNLEPPKLRLYQLTKRLAAKTLPYISSDLRYLGVIFDKYILSRGPTLVVTDREDTAYLCYGAKNEHKNTQNNLIEGDIRREMTVDTD